MKAAVIGCGYWGKNLVRNFHDLGALRAICDSDRRAVASLSATFGVPILELDAILARADIPAVAIAVPAAGHAVLVRKAIEAGKHVLVEKPLALDLGEAEELCALAERAQRILMAVHLLQYHPGFLKLKELCASGSLGRLLYVYSTRLNLGKLRRDENILWSFAPHDISMILSLAGGLPEEVWTTGARYLHRQIADVTTTHLRFANGINGHIFVSWLHPFKQQKLVVVGDRAMAVFDDGLGWSEKVQLFAHTVEWCDQVPVPNKAAAVPLPLSESEPLAEECRHFLDGIAAGAVVTADVAPFALMAGVPARRIGWVSHSGERLGDDLACPRAGRRYRLTGDDTLQEIANA